MSIQISIVIPVYNQEKHIEECLGSVFSQCNEQVEAIIVNDGSKDNSAAICEKMIRESQAQARLVNQENRGVLKSRLHGVAESKGEYILFVDSDDVLLDHAIETLRKAIDEQHPDMILFNATNSLSSRKPCFAIPLQDQKIYAKEERYEIHRLLCGSDVLNNLWTKCIRKDLFQYYKDPPVGAPKLTNGEDLYMIMALADKASSFLFLDQALYFYRVQDNSVSRVYNHNFFASEKYVCNARLGYAKAWSHTDELVPQARVWIYKIMREATRKALISDLPWAVIQGKIQEYRKDAFYREYYLEAKDAPDRRDIVLKGNKALLSIGRLGYLAKAQCKKALKKRA